MTDRITIWNADGTVHSTSQNMSGIRRAAGKMAVDRITLYRFDRTRLSSIDTAAKDQAEGQACMRPTWASNLALLRINFQDGLRAHIPFASWTMLCNVVRQWKNIVGCNVFMGEVTASLGKVSHERFISSIAPTLHNSSHFVAGLCPSEVKDDWLPGRTWSSLSCRSFTFGDMPFHSQFIEAFEKHVDGDTYDVENCQLLGTVQMTEPQLWDVLWKLRDEHEHEPSDDTDPRQPSDAGMLVSTILGTLGFEWI